jgi:Flp pilus assembly protein protease CpaA
LVELGTAAVFALLYAHYGLSGYLLLVSAYMAILILVTVTDLEHRLILNRVIGPAILLALIASPFTPDITWKQALVGGVIGFVFFYVDALVYPGGMGAGDVKLAAFIGLITGFPVVVLALLVTILAGGVISLFLVVTRLRSMRDAIPYGPFLVIGGAFSLIWGQPIVDDYLEQYRDTRVIETMFVQDERPDLYSEKKRKDAETPRPRRENSAPPLALPGTCVQGKCACRASVLLCASALKVSSNLMVPPGHIGYSKDGL